MSGFTDATEQGLLNYFIDTYGVTTKYLGLSSTLPTEAGGNFTEPSTGSYARVSTVAADWGAASGTAPAVKANTAVKTFPTATADWLAGANLMYFGLFSAAAAGTLYAWGLLAVAKPVLNGDTASFPAGQLQIKLGDPTDTY
jgi:hypothetical protein